MSHIKIETTVRKWYDTESDEVSIDGTEEREIQLSREVPDAETFVHLLNCTTNEAVRYAWDEINEEDQWEDWGWYGPYAKGNVTLYATRTGVTWDDVVDYIAEEENVADKAGVYLQMRTHPRTRDHTEETDVWMTRFLEYMADERGVDTSFWVHGRSP